MERSENRRELPAANDFDIKKYMSCLKKTWWVTALLTASYVSLKCAFYDYTSYKQRLVKRKFRV